MKNELKESGNGFSFELKETDIESDRDLFLKYKDKIPVMKINGTVFAKFRLDSKKFREKLVKLSV